MQTTENQKTARPTHDGFRKIIFLILMAAFLFPSLHVSAANHSDQLVDILYSKNKGNTVVSGMSVDSVMYMLLEGANGETREQIFSYLETDIEENREIYKTFLEKNGISSGIFSLLSGAGSSLSVVNSFWYDSNKGMDLNPEYEETISTFYNAKVSELDFDDTEKTAKEINKWCSQNTGDKIEEIVQPDDLSDTFSVIANALYFDGKWKEEFDPAVPIDFNGFKETYETDGMYSTEDAYYENNYATGFRKDYEDGYAFIGILPKEEGEFTLENLDIDGLMKSETNDYDVNIMLPKFTVNYETELSEAFKNFGVTDLFDKDDADLTGIAEGNMNLYLSKLLHKTYIDVNEQGTVAAAVTAGVMVLSDSVEPEEKCVYLDRPFAFLIMDTDTDTVLFAGKIVDLQ